MCGIVGICGKNRKDLVRKMAKNLKHRGPDDYGEFGDKEVFLAHRRLSIIDLSKGKQPMFNENKDIVVIFNGEIYNYVELREKLQKKHKFHTESDTEVLVHLYEEYGKNFVKKLNGIFSLAIYDLKKHLIILARDRVGVKPLYYYFNENENYLLFSSELKSLLLDKNIKKDLDPNLIKEYLQFGYISCPNTIIKDIHKLCPGKILSFNLKTKKPKIETYWKINLNRKKQKINNFKEIFENVIKDQTRSDVPIGFYLSGGMDSSSILAIYRELNPKGKILTFSVGFDSENVVNELFFSKKVAKAFKTEHHEIIVSKENLKDIEKIVYALDEPTHNLAAIPLYFMAKEASKKVRVVLTGNGGDEIFGGYVQHSIYALAFRIKKILKLLQVLAKNPEKIKNKKVRFLLELISRADNEAEMYKAFKYQEPAEELFKDNIRSEIEKDRSLEKIFSVENSSLNKAILIDILKLLPENYLAVDDKINMAFSIESRVPFLDNRMLEISEKLPEKQKNNILFRKIILKKSVKNLLPKEVLKRKKYGFTAPTKEWFFYIKDYLKESILSNKDLLNLLDQEKIISLFENEENIDFIWRLAILSIWLKTVLKK